MFLTATNQLTDNPKLVKKLAEEVKLVIDSIYIYCDACCMNIFQEPAKVVNGGGKKKSRKFRLSFLNGGNYQKLGGGLSEQQEIDAGFFKIYFNNLKGLKEKFNQSLPNDISEICQIILQLKEYSVDFLKELAALREQVRQVGTIKEKSKLLEIGMLITNDLYGVRKEEELGKANNQNKSGGYRLFISDEHKPKEESVKAKNYKALSEKFQIAQSETGKMGKLDDIVKKYHLQRALEENQQLLDLERFLSSP